MRLLRHSRRLSLVLAAAFAVCGWIGSSSGSLAFAAITEREHILAISLGDGHLDLVREHPSPDRVSGVATPIDPDHVVHLCHSEDAASSRPQTTATAGVDVAFLGETHRDPFAPARVLGTPRAARDVGARPLKATVRLL